ncbi:MAG: lytic transglycosylase domain-containing protein [Acidobacteriota bacterium]
MVPSPRDVAAERALSSWLASGSPNTRSGYRPLWSEAQAPRVDRFQLFPEAARRQVLLGGRYGLVITQIAERYRLDSALLAALVEAESGFNARVVSPAGAKGLMQMMPETLADYGVKDPFDPAANLDAGARYFSSLLQQFSGNVELALAAYNAGPAVVERYGAVPPYRETRAFVRRVLARYGSHVQAAGPKPSEILAAR